MNIGSPNVKKTNNLDDAVMNFIEDVFKAPKQNLTAEGLFEEAMQRNISHDPRVTALIKQTEARGKRIEESNKTVRRESNVRRWEQFVNKPVGPGDEEEGGSIGRLREAGIAPEQESIGYSKALLEAQRAGVAEDPRVQTQLQQMQGKDVAEEFGQEGQTQRGFIGGMMERGYPVDPGEAAKALPEDVSPLDQEYKKAQTQNLLTIAAERAQELREIERNATTGEPKEQSNEALEKAHQYLSQSISKVAQLRGQVKSLEDKKRELEKDQLSDTPEYESIITKIGEMESDMEALKNLEKTARNTLSALQKKGGNVLAETQWDQVEQNVIGPIAEKVSRMAKSFGKSTTQIDPTSPINASMKDFDPKAIDNLIMRELSKTQLDDVQKRRAYEMIKERVNGGGSIGGGSGGGAGIGTTDLDKQLAEKVRAKGVPEDKIAEEVRKIKIALRKKARGQ